MNQTPPDQDDRQPPRAPDPPKGWDDVEFQPRPASESQPDRFDKAPVDTLKVFGWVMLALIGLPVVAFLLLFGVCLLSAR